jgi:hypothetical protein
MAAKVRIKDQWKEQRLFEQRSVIGAGIIAALSVLLLARLVTLQVVRHDYYTDLSQGNRVRIEPLPAPRGMTRTAGEQAAGQLPGAAGPHGHGQQGRFRLEQAGQDGAQPRQVRDAVQHPEVGESAIKPPAAADGQQGLGLVEIDRGQAQS